MNIQPISPKFQSYSLTKVNFRGTRNPQEPAEKLQRILRDLYKNANNDGQLKRQSGFPCACYVKSQIVALLRECGATDIAEKLAKTVEDDLSAHY